VVVEEDAVGEIGREVYKKRSETPAGPELGCDIEKETQEGNKETKRREEKILHKCCKLRARKDENV
jgi:hypothetical protein